MTKKKSSMKREYKLTTKQAKKAKSLYSKGATSLSKLQAGLKKAKIPASRQSVSNWMQATKKGKRAPSPFWKQVARLKKESGFSHKKATGIVKQYTKWGAKRAGKKGKKWYSPEERIARMKALREEFEGEELGDRINQELEDVMYGDTPK